MKFKYYLRGCGFGILLTVIVLAVAIHNRGGVMTDEKAIARAEALGMVMPEDTESTQEPEPESETEQPAAIEAPESETAVTQQPESEQASEEESEEASGETSRTEDETSEVDAGTDADADAEDDSDGIIEIEVKSGDACRQVAEKLYDKGLVEDAEEFRLFMAKKGYDNKIYVGTYQLEKGMTYSEIAETLIKKQE